jgi:hypothetical protein
LYNDQVKAVVEIAKTKAPYKGFVFNVAEYEGYLTLRLYRDNYEEFSEDQKVALGIWISDLMVSIRAITPCYLEVFENVPTGRVPR